ncbi:putative tail fiber assembly protein [Rhizobium phage RHph_TM16]|nr:putative tail fiber assembly protein [Rhizobium phage RHph_TM16]
MPKLYYNVDPLLKFFIGFSWADPDPVMNPNADDDGVWVLPGYATFVSPPEEVEGNIRVFDFTLNKWGYVKPEDLGIVEPTPEPQGPSAFDVDTEMERRSQDLFVFAGIVFQCRVKDQKRIAGAAAAALAAMMAGAQAGDFRWADPDADFKWIDVNNNEHVMDAQTMFAFGRAAMKWESDHIFAARALKDTVPIPDDYREDEHWPAVPVAPVTEGEPDPGEDQPSE